MNKNLYRIVFNASRGQRMAVAETAGSCGKGRNASSSPAGKALAFAALALITAAHAQIVADPTAPGTQRPTVLAAPNGVPLVNIQTPSAAGVSRNTYSQFDINRPGALLNNSRTNVQTQLGGWVQGNPWLATGSAKVILNEVNSSHPSLLKGHVEVAGQKADVIIANPAGIKVDGAGFINAERVVLTTGTPILGAQGSLDSYRVQRGTVVVEGLGLDTRTAGITQILARATEINAGLWANYLQITTGAIPGACIVYRVIATNIGTQNVTTVQIFDTTPPNTTCVGTPFSTSASAPTVTPSPAAACTLATTAAASIQTSGVTLLPNESVNLFFRVRINP